MRSGPGMGRCQGSFCESEVFKILNNELDINAKDILQDKNNSEVISSFVKEDL